MKKSVTQFRLQALIEVRLLTVEKVELKKIPGSLIRTCLRELF